MGLLSMFEGGVNGLLGRQVFNDPSMPPQSAAPQAMPDQGPGIGSLLSHLILNGESFDQTRMHYNRQKFLGELGQMIRGTPGQPAGPPQQVGVTNSDGADITSAFGPQFNPGTPARPASGPSINDPRWAKAALMAPMLGVNLKDVFDVLKAQQPDSAYDNGIGYNKKSDQSGVFHPTLDKGQEPLFDSRGNIVGIRNMDGSVQAASEMAGATEGAKARAQAPYQAVQTYNRQGAPVTIRALDLPGNSPGAMGGGGPAQGGGASPAYGVGQTPAEKVTAEGTAKTAVERAANQPKAAATISDADRVTDFSRGTIHDILGETQDKSGKWVKSGPSQVNWATAGVLGATKDIPGSPAHNLKAKLDTILAQTSMGELQKMRDESPTGGALGRVTQQEINLLAAMRGSIEQTQSGDQLEKSLRHHLDQLDKLAAIRQKMFNEQYPSAAGGGYNRADLEAEARRRGLLK